NPRWRAAPVPSWRSPFSICSAGPALTMSLRVLWQACDRFALISESCTWSQHTNSQEAEVSDSKRGSVDETVARLSFQNVSGTKVGLFGRFDSTSRVRKVMNVWLSTLGSGAPNVVLSNLTSPTN